MNLIKNGTIISVKEIAKRTIEVAIKIPETFSFIAGQYIWLELPKLKCPDPKGNTRMFSIASSPNKKGELNVVFRNSESGYKKTLIEMPVGTGVVFSGPYGSLELPKDSSRPIVLVAGGIGVAPFLSMINFWSETSAGNDITLFYTNGNKEETAYLDELSKIEKKNPNFTLINHLGLLDLSLLEKFLSSEVVWFVIGPEGFVDNVGNFLIKNHVSPELMIFEQFYPSVLPKSKFEQKLESVNPDFGEADHPYLLALDSASNHIVITDTNGIILYANKGAEAMTGYTLAEMRGNTPRLWGALMSADFYKNLWQTIKYDKKTFLGEVKNRRKNQEEYYAFMRISPIIDRGGNLTGFVVTEEDITDQKQIAKDLNDAKIAAQNVFDDLDIEKSKVEIAKAKEEAILYSIGDGLVATDEQGKIILMNKTAEKLLDIQSEKSIGKVFYEVMHLEDERGVAIPLDKHPINIVLATRTTITTSSTYNYRRKDRKKIPVAITVTPVIFKGRVIGAIEVFRDITKEKEIDKAKSEFVSLASHQLRTPLTTINWYSEMLLGGQIGKSIKKQKEYLERIHAGSEQMVTLVNTLLNVSRIEMGTMPVEPKPVLITKLLNDVLNEQKLQIDQKKISIASNFTEDIPEIQTDSNLLHMVFQNLISNALKYTALGGHIDISVLVKNTTIIVTLSDTGYGIPKKDQDKIFTKMFRADNVKEKSGEGTGLGLYIVKSILTNLGGNIRFESEENKGSTFYVEIPLSRAKKK